MAKEDKKQNENVKENEKIDDMDLTNFCSILIPFITNLFNNNNNFESKQLYELYHSLDKRLSILESKIYKKRFFLF